jgi:hypothetical protein
MAIPTSTKREKAWNGLKNVAADDNNVHFAECSCEFL